MAEFLENDAQNVALNAPVLFDSSIPCNRGYVFHENGTGNFILRGVTNNCFARYQVTYGANISIPEGGAVTAIALSISVNGEERPTSRSVFTPTAVEVLGKADGTAIVTVPKGCCVNVAVRYVDATVNDPAVTPTPVITVQNSNLVITRIA